MTLKKTWKIEGPTVTPRRRYSEEQRDLLPFNVLLSFHLEDDKTRFVQIDMQPNAAEALAAELIAGATRVRELRAETRKRTKAQARADRDIREISDAATHSFEPNARGQEGPEVLRKLLQL